LLKIIHNGNAITPWIFLRIFLEKELTKCAVFSLIFLKKYIISFSITGVQKIEL